MGNATAQYLKGLIANCLACGPFMLKYLTFRRREVKLYVEWSVVVIA